MTIRTKLLSLPFVTTRRLSTREGFFTAGKMFALVDDQSMLIRLPDAVSADLVDRALSAPVIGAPAPADLVWVAVELGRHGEEALDRLVAAAHEAVRRSSRRSPRSRGRRRRNRAIA